MPDRPERLVLDTDVASRLLRDRLTGPLVPRVIGRPWCVTFVTVGELWLWAFSRRWGSRSRRELEEWLRGVTILPYSREVARTWGQIMAAARLRGRPRPQNDTWIAACCLADGLPLATGNVKDHVDFAEHEGLHLIHK